MNFDAMNAACLSAFGQTLILNGTTQITGIVERPVAPSGARRMAQFGSAQTLGPDDLRITLDTAGGPSIAVGHTVALDGKTYRVARLWPDDGGMTTLELRA